MVGTKSQNRLWRHAPFVLLATLLTLLLAAIPASAAQDFGDPVPGQRIYDRTNTLTATELRDLENRANAVAAAGAPTIVYLRAKNADEDDTQRDARDLMAAWSVESAPGARDGVVIFMNLDPKNTRHGQLALFAGERHYQNGNLPERELQRIFDDEMRPLLADEQTAAGLGAGLNAIANSLTYGPAPAPEPSPLQRAARQIARLPLNALALLGTLGALFLAVRTWQARPAPAAPGAPTLARPDTLSPALAGALVGRGINTTQLAEATLLDLARRGALVVEPAGHNSAQVRPLNATLLASNHEQQLWTALASATDASGIVPGKALGKLLAHPGDFKAALHTELVARGWYDPAAASHRYPAYFAGLAAIAAAAIAAIIAGIGQEPWGLPAVIILFGSGIALLVTGAALPETTAEGERAAAPWHAYRAGLDQAARNPNQPLDLDTILPDAIALGTIAKLDKRIKEASNAGYSPAWFVRPTGHDAPASFYPVWIALHSTTNSSSSSGSSAATGGGGAGGSF